MYTISCSTCDEEGIICDDCKTLGYASPNTLKRKCKLCQLDDLPCSRMHELSWISDSEASQRAYSTVLQGKNPKAPIPDPPHVLKLGNNSGLNIIDIKQILNKSFALLQLEANDADVEPGKGEASSQTSPSRKVKPFFQAILREDLHRSNDGVFERTMHINWLEPSEEDPLVYTVGNEDNNNPPQCILDNATLVQDGEKFLLSRNEEQRLKNLANGSDEDDYESSGEKESDGDNREDDDDQPTRFEAGSSRSGRRVTRFVF
ncbi:hypothetical protein AWC38_SpisGene13985 [Stylophora pistillata]|uniref:Uncharacterized protein n=1 Tax=Stylophora pistillata TaxID=50429 RepID=A0A2B4RVA6_STYPI|nr:hypothetical protein AWC38_SpisGene13985 [Stylophora pistillata]